MLIFLIVLSILILVHEWGHFITAKSVGVKVEKFSLGFGPKLFSFMHQGTEFMVCAIPLGGFVKMAGDERSECKGKKDEYFSKSVGHRALIVLMGPVVNYVLAYICLCFVFMFGYPALAPKVAEVIKGYPAEAAGFKKGDTIIKVDAKNIQSWEDVQKYISRSTGAQLHVVFLRDGQRMEKTVSPVEQLSENIFGQKEKIRRIGIQPEDKIITLKYTFLESLVKSFSNLTEITTTTYKALYRMATGAVSIKELSGPAGPTGIIGLFYLIQKASEAGFTYLLYVVGVISASLALFNILPLPVLDGGHLLFLGIEKIRGKGLSPKADEMIARIGISFFVCLAFFVFYLDFVRFGWIAKIMGIWKQIGF